MDSTKEAELKEKTELSGSKHIDTTIDKTTLEKYSDVDRKDEDEKKKQDVETEKEAEKKGILDTLFGKKKR